MEPTGKEKKVFVIRVVIFFAVFLCLFLVINRVFLYKDNNFYNYVNYMSQPEESIDILVMGSSHSIGIWSPCFRLQYEHYQHADRADCLPAAGGSQKPEP